MPYSAASLTLLGIKNETATATTAAQFDEKFEFEATEEEKDETEETEALTDSSRPDGLGHFLYPEIEGHEAAQLHF